MKKIKCPHCNQTLFYAENAKIEIKCSRCKKIFRFDIEDTKSDFKFTPINGKIAGDAFRRVLSKISESES